MAKNLKERLQRINRLQKYIKMILVEKCVRLKMFSGTGIGKIPHSLRVNTGRKKENTTHPYNQDAVENQDEDDNHESESMFERITEERYICK